MSAVFWQRRAEKIDSEVEEARMLLLSLAGDTPYELYQIEAPYHDGWKFSYNDRLIGEDIPSEAVLVTVKEALYHAGKYEATHGEYEQFERKDDYSEL